MLPYAVPRHDAPVLSCDEQPSAQQRALSGTGAQLALPAVPGAAPLPSSRAHAARGHSGTSRLRFSRGVAKEVSTSRMLQLHTPTVPTDVRAAGQLRASAPLLPPLVGRAHEGERDRCVLPETEEQGEGGVPGPRPLGAEAEQALAAREGEDAAPAPPAARGKWTERRLLKLSRALTPVHKVAGNMLRYGDAIERSGRVAVALLSTSAFNPVHIMHLRMFYRAKQFLEQHTRFFVVGGLLAPYHDTVVKSQNRRFPRQAIPALHRVRMCQAMVAESSWLAVDTWGVTRKLNMEYPSVLRHVQQCLARLHPFDVKVMFLCSADHLLQCSPATFKDFGCVCVTRPGYDEQSAIRLGDKWLGLVHVVEDSSVLSRGLDAASAKRARRRLISGEPVEEMVGPRVDAYLREHRIAEKMRGGLPWEAGDRDLGSLRSEGES